MPTHPRKKKPELFNEAKLSWNLDSLYDNLAKIKGKSLTFTEKSHLRGLLCGYSPSEIAEQINRDVHGVESDLSGTIYRYVKVLVQKEKTKVENWRNISDWLEKAGYKVKMEVNSSSSQSGVEIPVKQLDGFLRISRINNCLNNCETVHFEINLRGTTDLPLEEKLKKERLEISGEVSSLKK